MKTKTITLEDVLDNFYTRDEGIYMLQENKDVLNLRKKLENLDENKLRDISSKSPDIFEKIDYVLYFFGLRLRKEAFLKGKNLNPDSFNEKKLEYFISRSIFDGNYLRIMEKAKYIYEGKKVEFFPGSLSEFENLKEMRYKIFSNEIYIEKYNYNHLFWIGKNEIEGLIRWRSKFVPEGYGIPVRKIN